MAEPTFSPDGKWMWNGEEWIPSPPSSDSGTEHRTEIQSSTIPSIDVEKSSKSEFRFNIRTGSYSQNVIIRPKYLNILTGGFEVLINHNDVINTTWKRGKKDGILGMRYELIHDFGGGLGEISIVFYKKTTLLMDHLYKIEVNNPELTLNFSHLI